MTISKCDTHNIEREHTQNARKTTHRGHTHCQDVETLSATRLLGNFIDYYHVEGDGNADDESSDAPRRSRATAPTAQARRVRPKPGGSWAWKAFCNIRSGGSFLSPALSAQLSLEYKDLNGEEYQQYVEMGVSAKERWVQGLDMFDRGDRSRGRARMAELHRGLGYVHRRKSTARDR